ncbi:MAG TPA: alpha/beta hydrolase family protein [Anaerolineae bacterium]|nr:alpha/beta hydrolase family protein [Anaerolineae bacterium]HNU03386.1 alpha/beta hydrolase family protein [Anaerolineae bacterium]
MALIQCDFFSETLQLGASMNVILPQPARARYPVLYLLHGLSDDHSTWLRRTSIERYADALGLAVVMPAAHRSFYTDMARGYRYWTFISQELPALARGFFPISHRREETFVAGLSMGGYGAFKLALSFPERFAAAASLSGALDQAGAMQQDEPAWRAEMENIYGDLDQVVGSANDTMHLAAQVARSSGPKPRLYQCCGTEDFLYGHNLRFRAHALALGLDLTYEEGPGGHDWGYWDRMIQRVLAWLPMEDEAAHG